MDPLEDYVNHLAETLTKHTLSQFFHEIHARFFPDQDISFMNFFLEIVKKRKEFCIEHTKLIEYGVLTSNESSVVRRKLERHNLKEGVDFKVDTSVDLSSSTKQTKNIYYLTPIAFKKCLIKTKRHPSQKIDPEYATFANVAYFLWYFL